MEHHKDITWRLKLLYFGVLILAFFILGQAFKVGVFERDIWIEKNEEVTLKWFTTEATRGNIYSSDGGLLATSVPIYDLYIDLTVKPLTDEIFNENIDSLGYYLSTTFKDKSQQQYVSELRKARKAGKEYYSIKRGVSHSDLMKAKNFPIFRLGRYKGGFRYDQRDKRELPYRYIGKQMIGKVVDSLNKTGIEGAYDDMLRGQSGKSLKRKLSGGQWKPVYDKYDVEPIDGYDVISTIDIRMQDLAEHALLKQLIKHQAESGCVVLMEVETGHVKAIANLTNVRDTVYDETYNDAISRSSEPGSTFKLFNMIALMEGGYVKLTDTVDTKGGKVQVGPKLVKDSHEGGYGKITVARGFEVSSNTVIAQVLYKAFKDKPMEYIQRLKQLGIDQKLAIELANEGAPRLNQPGKKGWSGYSLPSLSMGYEVMMTPLQVLTIYNAVANNGVMMKPKFVKEIRNKQRSVKKIEPEILNPAICSQPTLAMVKSILEGVVENGTATNLKNAHYKIAGKTGTAKMSSGKDGYEDRNYQASFAGYFPAEKPRYSCIVVVYRPTLGGYYGNVVAGSVFKEIADKIYAQSIDMHDDSSDAVLQLAEIGFPNVKNGFTKDISALLDYFNLKAEYENAGQWSTWKSGDNKPIIKPLHLTEEVVPNVKGMGLRDALFLLESVGLKVKVSGKGTVRRQSINPGERVKRDSNIEIELS